MLKGTLLNNITAPVVTAPVVTGPKKLRLVFTYETKVVESVAKVNRPDNRGLFYRASLSGDFYSSYDFYADSFDDALKAVGMTEADVKKNFPREAVKSEVKF